MLSIEDYEDWVLRTAKHPLSLNYTSAGLAAEAGEFNNDMVRKMRQLHKTEILVSDLHDNERFKLSVELGDMLWNITRSAQMMGMSLTDIANLNHNKLEDRERRGIAYRTEITPDAWPLTFSMELTEILELARAADIGVSLETTIAHAPLLGTCEDRKRWAKAWKTFQYLPRQGEFGGGMADIARQVGVSRNFVHLTIYPHKKDTIFTGNSERQISIWEALAGWVNSHPLKQPIEKIMEELLTRGVAEVKIRKSMFTFLTKRLSTMGIEHRVTEERLTSPRTYVIELRDPKQARSVALIGKDLLDKNQV